MIPVATAGNFHGWPWPQAAPILKKADVEKRKERGKTKNG
jgi:hypothetical protein